MIERLGDKKKFCKYCLADNHTMFHCPKRPRSTLQTYNGLKVSSSFGGQRKPMKQRGAVTNKWIATRKQWLADNPPNHAGYYTCHICTKPVLASEMELDHVVSRTRAPELRFVMSNLKPSHHTCNSLKGSRDVGESHI